MGRLASVSLFKDLGIDLAPYEARSNWRRFDPGEVLLDFEDLSTDVYFLLAGEVRVLMRTAAGKEVILTDMRAGDLFGELSALDSIRRSANVTAITRGEVCVMAASLFRELVFSSRGVADRLFRVLTGRIRDLNERLMEQTILDLRHRLYAELLRLSIPRAHGVNGGTHERVVTPPPFHHVLAARIGCRREQVTREFTMMTQEGLIERTRGALVLKHPDILQTRVEEAMREDA